MELNTKDKVKNNDPSVYSLLTNNEYKFQLNFLTENTDSNNF